MSVDDDRRKDGHTNSSADSPPFLLPSTEVSWAGWGVVAAGLDSSRGVDVSSGSQPGGCDPPGGRQMLLGGRQMILKKINNNNKKVFGPPATE